MGRPPIRVALRHAFWARVRAGAAPIEAADQAGVSRSVAARWFTQAGGVLPTAVPVPEPGRKTFRLSFEDRAEIAGLHAAGKGVRQIAEVTGRAPSTICNELKRCGCRRQRACSYRPAAAQADADAKARRPKTALLAANQRLREHVQKRLDCKDSPVQISRRLRLDFPDDPEMQVSAETIYQSLYVQGRGALRRELITCLRTGRTLRRPRRTSTERRGRIPNMVNIADRPTEADDRAVPGHWEGDLITGAANKSAIGTLVERATGFLILLHLPDAHGAVQVQAAMTEAMADLPRTLRRTLAWDQGSEMANHVQIAAATELDIYFCDPHSPWQRAVNENTNGLLRQYFPKGTDLSGYHRDYLTFVAAQMNNRPRKRLNWRTPAERLDELLSTPHEHTDVSMTG